MKKASLGLVMAISLALSATLSTGCAPLIFGAAVVAGGTMITTMIDRRSAGAVLSDSVMQKRIVLEIGRALGEGAKTHITVSAYNGQVLLTGEVSTAEQKQQAVLMARSSLDVVKVIDELVVMEPTSLSQRWSDSRLATRVRANITGDKYLSIIQMNVTVDRGVVYLMGILTPQEHKLATEVVAKTSGVVRVVSFAEILSPERVRAIEEENARRAREAAAQGQTQP